MRLAATFRKSTPHKAELARAFNVWFLTAIMLMASMAQATHIHGGLLKPSKAPHAAAISADDSSAETCPLCVAMHSARPVTVDAEYGKTHVAAFLIVAEYGDVSLAPIAFTHFSRPPPLS